MQQVLGAHQRDEDARDADAFAAAEPSFSASLSLLDVHFRSGEQLVGAVAAAAARTRHGQRHAAKTDSSASIAPVTYDLGASDIKFVVARLAVMSGETLPDDEPAESEEVPEVPSVARAAFSRRWFRHENIWRERREGAIRSAPAPRGCHNNEDTSWRMGESASSLLAQICSQSRSTLARFLHKA